MSSTGNQPQRTCCSRWDILPDSSYRRPRTREPSRVQEGLKHDHNYCKEVPRRTRRYKNFAEGRSSHDPRYGNFQMQPRYEQQRTFPNRQRSTLQYPRARNLIHIEPMPEAEFAQHVRRANCPQNDIVSVYQRFVACGAVTEEDQTKLTMEIVKNASQSLFTKICSELSKYATCM